MTSEDRLVGDLVAGDDLLGMKDRGSVVDRCLSATLSRARLDVDGLDLKDFGNAGTEPGAIARRSNLGLTVPTAGLRFSTDGNLSPGTFSRFGVTPGLLQLLAHIRQKNRNRAERGRTWPPRISILRSEQRD